MSAPVISLFLVFVKLGIILNVTLPSIRIFSMQSIFLVFDIFLGFL